MEQKDEHLLSPGAACRLLGMNPGHKDWQRVRKILIEDYGMTHIEGVGTKIPYFKVKKFLADYFDN